MTDKITPKQFRESEGVEDWRVLGDGANAYFRTGSLAKGARLVQAISELPGVDELQPDIDVRHDGVTVRMVAFIEGYGGMLKPHVELARKISAAARGLGFSADPTAVQNVLVIPGATSRSEVMPFWFEQMEKPRPDGGGAIHLAVWVPFAQAEARIAAALAAGGRMVRDEFAPSWWTPDDAAGNEADIATTKGRD